MDADRVAFGRINAYAHLLRRTLRALLFVLPGWMSGATVFAQGTVQYIYDDASRLTGVISPTGDAAQYVYDAAGNLSSVNRASATAVAILDFSPRSALPGTTVTVSGTGFSATAAQDSVRFNGTLATVSSASANQLVVTVPAGATTGTLSVSAPAGSATSLQSFTVLSASGTPVISAVSPGMALAGAAVSVSGSNFPTTLTGTRLRFNVAAATISALASGSITTSVPAGASSGPLRLGTPQGDVTSPADFFVIPAGHVATDIGYTGRTGVDAGDVPITLAANKLALLLFDVTPVQGQRLRLVVSPVSAGAASVSLTSPAGVALSSVSAGTSGATIISPPLPGAGTYTILVSAGATGFTGTLSLRSLGSVVVDASTAAASVSRAGENTGLLLAGVAGQRLGVGVGLSGFTGALNIGVLNPDGTTLASFPSLTTNSTGAGLALPVLSQTGTYLVQAISGVSTTATMGFTVSSALGGSMSVNGAGVSYAPTRVGQPGAYSVSGTAGQNLSLVSTVSSGLSSGLAVQLFNSAGVAVGSSLGLAAGQSVADFVSLPATDTYTVQVLPNGIGTGATTLNLVGEATGTLAIDGATVALSTPVGQNVRLSFTDPTGANVGVGVVVSTLSSGGLISGRVTYPSGSVQTFNNFTSTGAQSLQLTGLSASGSPYTLFLDPYGATTASVAVTASSVLTGSLTPGGAALVLSTARPGQFARYSFSGSAGQNLSLVSNTSSGFSAGLQVQLLNSSGTAVGSLLSLGSGLSVADLPSLPANDTYTLQVVPRNAGTGTSSLNLVGEATATVAIDGASTVITNAVGQNLRLSFTDTTGSDLGLGVVVSALSSGGLISGRVTYPSGSFQTFNNFTSAGGQALQLTGLSASGSPYTITLDPGATTTANIAVTASSVLTGSITPGGAAAVFSTTRPGQFGRYGFSVASAGQKATVSIAAGSTLPSGSQVQLQGSTGTVLASGTFGSGATSFTSAALAVGSYSLVVLPNAAATGSVTFSLTLQ